MNNICPNCGKNTGGKRKYCSYKCRNIYVNKNLRDYKKNSEGLSGEKEYVKNPKICECCGRKIPYKKRRNKYCNSSCHATHTNPNRKGEKRNFTKKGLEALRESALKIHGDNYIKKCKKYREQYKTNPNKCCQCKQPLEWKKRNNKYCSRKCINNYQRKHLNNYQKYFRECQFKFALNEYPDEFDFSLIEQHGWYSAANRGNNLYGVSRDHIFSISEGYKQNVDAKLIAHPANCRLMLQSDNVRKHSGCDITIEELKIKINNWNKKYNKITEG